MRNRLGCALAALLAPFAPFAGPSASADVIAPAAAGSGSAVIAWGDYCHARFERARAELGHESARFGEGKIVLDEGAVHYIYARKTSPAATVYHARVSPTRERDGDGSWQREPGPEVHLHRRWGGREGRVDAADPAGIEERYASIFRRAVDDCLAAGAVAAAAPRSYAGQWTFDGGIRYDGCAGALVLRTGEFVISPDEKSLHSVRLGRDYHLRFENGMLIAENTFPDMNCPGKTFSERWVLAPTRDGGLEGGLDTTWDRRPMCGSPCDVDFYITARRDRRGAQ